MRKFTPGQSPIKFMAKSSPKRPFSRALAAPFQLRKSLVRLSSIDEYMRAGQWLFYALRPQT